ncbi:MAG: winged helix-turn-helix domain-containing protein [Gammaproteobacteria bacterium]
MSARGDRTQFGPFRLFPAERQLLKGDTPVQIGSREFDILIALVERAGQVVTKRELFARVWPGVVVEESSLRVHVAGLRKVLADGQDPTRYIVNVPGRGYSFVASLTGALAPASPAWARDPPHRATRVIGRDNDIRAVAELIAGHRFVTLHGPGGVGKTTLGLAVAGAQAYAFADGVGFVDLSLNIGVHTAADALASVLGLVVRTSDPTANILDFIRGRAMLLVLDSCETTIGDAAALAESIIRQAPGVAILATSREPLRAQSEYVYPLEPLSVPPEGLIATTSDLLVFPAAELFCERAVAAGYRAELNDADAVIVGDICRRVDGNALALELAASRVSTYGLRQTADLLDSHMKLAWRGRRTAPPRHQTLTAMLDWSYALIDERERDVLRRLSVFVGVFGLEEIRGVAGDSDEVIEAFEQLVLKSLVAVDTNEPRPRYRLLDTTRAYARAKLLEAGAAGEVSRRHARYYLDWLTRSTHVAAVSVEHTSNIRAALEWTFSNGGDTETGLGLATYACELFLRLGMLTESRRCSERALEALPPELAGSHREVALRTALAFALMFTGGSSNVVRESLENALGMAERLGDRTHQFRLLGGLHMYHRRAGAVDELLPTARRAAAIVPLLGGAAEVAAQTLLGVSNHVKGNLDAAYAALAAVRKVPVDPNGMINFHGLHREAHAMIAVTLWFRGFPDQAAQAAAPSAASIDVGRDPVTACLCLLWSAIAYYFRGDWAIAEGYLERLIRVASEHALAPHKWLGVGIRGSVKVQRGEADEGVSDLWESLRRLEAGGFVVYTPWLTCCLAEALASRRDLAQARSLINALDPAPGSRSDVYMPEYLRVWGSVLAQAGDVAAAERAFQHSIEMADTQGALSWRLRTVSSQARLRLEQGRLPEAREPLAQTYGRFTEGFETLDLRTARALLAQIDARAEAIAPG